MAYQIKLSKLFIRKVVYILKYLEENWSKKVADEFTETLDKKMLLLAKNSLIGKDCDKDLTVKRILITPHNKLFYRVKGRTVFIITLFDTRQNPKKKQV